MTNTREIEYISVMRGITSILVVIGHYLPENSPAWYETMNKFIYSFHMPLFFIISGYVYSISEVNIYKDFIEKKIRRLIVPYLTTSILIITIKLFSEKYMYLENPIDIYAYLRLFYFPSAGYFLWFIWVLFEIFIIIPMFKTKTSKLILSFIALLIYFIPIDFSELFCFNMFKRYLIFFMIGVMCYNYKKSLLFKGKFIIGIFATFIIFTHVYINYKDNLSYIFSGISGTLVIAYCANFKYNKTILSLLKYLSTTSFFIYLFHTTFQGLIKGILNRFIELGQNEMIFCITTLLVIICGIIMPILLFQFINRNKYLTPLFGIKSYVSISKNKI